MSAPILYLSEAKRHIAAFAEEVARRHHHTAMDCLDCEAYLQLGIDAFDWLTKTDRVIRRAIYNGTVEYDASVDEVIETLFRTWLEPCKKAYQWIAQVQKNEYCLDNLDKFRACEAEVEAMVKFLDDDKMTPAIRDLRDKAIAEHGRGETVEFV